MSNEWKENARTVPLASIRFSVWQCLSCRARTGSQWNSIRNSLCKLTHRTGEMSSHIPIVLHAIAWEFRAPHTSRTLNYLHKTIIIFHETVTDPGPARFQIRKRETFSTQITITIGSIREKHHTWDSENSFIIHQLIRFERGNETTKRRNDETTRFEWIYILIFLSRNLFLSMVKHFICSHFSEMFILVKFCASFWQANDDMRFRSNNIICQQY